MARATNKKRGPLPAEVFHLAEAGNWDLIRQQGLHSATRLIELAGMSEEEARPFKTYRNRAMKLPSGVLLRDQRPMPPSALERCLRDGLTPQDWYDQVNSKIFFWFSKGRLLRHLGACLPNPQVLITINASALIEQYGSQACVTPFNVGNARRKPSVRSLKTFVPFEVWISTRWESERPGHETSRPASHPPAELVVGCSIPDLSDFIIRVQSISADGSIGQVF
jgi:hypothetical protein